MRKKIETYGTYFLIGAIIVDVVLLLYYNFFIIPQVIDEDYAKLLVHIKEMGDNKTLFPAYWEYMSSGELDSAALPAFFFFLITHRLVFSFALANVLNIAFFSFMLLYLLEMIGVKTRYRLLALFAVLTAYDFGQLEYTNMLFIAGGQYIYKMMLPLLFVLLLLAPAERHRKKPVLFFAAFYYLMLLVTGMCSWLYVFVSTLLPVMICVVFYLLRGDGMLKTRWVYTHMIATVVVSAAGVFLNHALHISTNSTWYRMKSLTRIRETLFTTLFDFLKLFRALDPSEELQPFTVDGIAGLLRLFIACCILFGGAFSLKYLFGLRPQKTSTLMDKARTFFISAFFWAYLILFLTTSTPRYHIPGAVMLILCAVIFLQQMMEREETPAVPHVLTLGLSAVLLVINLTSLYRARTVYLHSEDYYRNLCEEVISYMEEYDMQTGFTINEACVADLLRVHDQTRTYESYMNENNVVWNRNYYLMDRDRSRFEARNLLVGQQHEFDACPEFIRMQYEHVATVGYGAYQIWISDTCSMDGMSGLFPHDASQDLPTTVGYSYNGEIDPEGALLTTVAGEVLSSPEIVFDPTEKGVRDAYTATLHYECPADTGAAWELLRGEEVVERVPLTAKEQRAQMTIAEPGTYRMRVMNGDGILRLKTIIFESKGQVQ